MHIIIDSLAAHAVASEHLVAEYRAWLSAEDAANGLPPVKRDTHTFRLPAAKIQLVMDRDGNPVGLDGAKVDPKKSEPGQELIIRAKLVVPDFTADIRREIGNIVKQHLGDARDTTIPKIEKDSGGILDRPEVVALIGQSFDVQK